MKKILSMLLVLVLLFAMAPAAHAAKWEITGLDPNYDFDAALITDYDLGDVYPGMTVLEAAAAAQGIPGSVLPFDTLPFFIYAEMFLYNGESMQYWFTNGTPEERASLQDFLMSLVTSPSKLDKYLQVRIRAANQRGLFETIKYKGIKITGMPTNAKIAALDFRFKDRHVSTEELDFEVDLYFGVGDSRTDDTKYITLTGTFKNHVTEVFANSVEADTWEGQVIDAQEYVGNIVLVGNKDEDVLAHIKMANGKKVYFVVDTDGDIKDEPIMDKYPAIEWAYTVYQVGLNTISGNFIELAGVDDSYYVYGKNADGTLKYLGRGGELFPFSAKYYISSAKLELDDEAFGEDLPEEEEDLPGYNPSTGI